jgi:nucleosome binding factor SPN SPT16 subunit
MDVVQTLEGGRRALHDPDELEEEQRERERRNKINADFQQFVRRVQEMWEKDMPDLNLEFDVPFRWGAVGRGGGRGGQSGAARGAPAAPPPPRQCAAPL